MKALAMLLALVLASLAGCSSEGGDDPVREHLSVHVHGDGLWAVLVPVPQWEGGPTVEEWATHLGGRAEGTQVRLQGDASGIFEAAIDSEAECDILADADIPGPPTRLPVEVHEGLLDTLAWNYEGLSECVSREANYGALELLGPGVHELAGSDNTARF